MQQAQKILAMLVLCFGCVPPSFASPSDVADIYGTFLDAWTGKEKDPLNVSISAKAPSSEELKEIAGCVTSAGAINWLQAEPLADLTSALGQISYVHLVDPASWGPQDPGDLIAQGKPVDSAVKSGFENGLLTFSAIVFDESHSTAAFTYSFVCGRLCGSGGAVVFHKQSNGWAQASKQCGEWISDIQEGRSNNSFKPKPLRGSA
jgi:hypothetical protein